MANEISPTDFLKAAAGTAEYFGFRDVGIYRNHPQCVTCTTSRDHNASAQDRKLDALQGLLASGINTYTNHKLYALEEPVFLYNFEQVPRTGEVAFSLQVFNVAKSIAETLLIQTASAIANDLGYTDHTVRINSLGDNDSVTRYTRELTNYLRKRANDLPPAARELMKEHVATALMHLVEKEHELAYRSPNPLEYLSDASRKHFREIVEYLDMSETPYEIDPKLIGHFNCYSDALFSIDIAHNDPLTPSPLFIRGGRYNSFMRRHTKHDVAAAGAVIMLRGKKAPRRIPRAGKAVQPSVYVVQLGFGPKIRSLMLINMLRSAAIPTYQNLASDSLSAQLRDAEERKVRYTIVIGQKEYVDRTVILRDMFGRSQEQVPMDALVQRLRRMQTSA